MGFERRGELREQNIRFAPRKPAWPTAIPPSPTLFALFYGASNGRPWKGKSEAKNALRGFSHVRLRFRKSGQRAAFPLDEFGTMPVKQRKDGTWLIDGLFEIEKLTERLEGFIIPEGGGDEFQTVSGWFMHELGRVPAETDRLTAGEWTFEVLDMDSTRVDKVLAIRRAPNSLPENQDCEG